MNILLTGASRGIGAATYELLGSRGNQVVGHSTRGSGELIAGDLADPEAPRKIWEEAVERLGMIDALVNNAGIYEGIDVDTTDTDWQAAWTRTLSINLTSVADLSREAAEAFARRDVTTIRFDTRPLPSGPYHLVLATPEGTECLELRIEN